MAKKNESHLAQWGDISFPIEINRCEKCGGMLKRVPALGIIAIGVCKVCKRFYGLEINDITSKLKSSFKKKFV